MHSNKDPTQTKINKNLKKERPSKEQVYILSTRAESHSPVNLKEAGKCSSAQEKEAKF